MAEIIEGYWFAASDELPHGDGRKVVLGETLRVKPPIELCKSGLHASEHPFDSLTYARGPLLYRVRLSGTILRDSDKCCATARTALALLNAEQLLRTFARRQALSVIHLWDAPEVVREYLETGDENKRYTARAAAWDAARPAARTAAWDAARDAAWTAARDAAWDAARAAAQDAAWDAARAMFKEMVEESFAPEAIQ